MKFAALIFAAMLSASAAAQPDNEQKDRQHFVEQLEPWVNVLETDVEHAKRLKYSPYFFYGERDAWSPYGNYLPEPTR